MKPLLLVALAQALCAALYFVAKRPSTAAERVVAVLFAAIGSVFAIKLWVLEGGTPTPLLSAIHHALPFSFPPLLYLYGVLVMSERPRWKASSFLHFLPLFLAFIGCLLGAGSFPDELARVRPPDPHLPPEIHPGGPSGRIDRQATAVLYGSLVGVSLVYASKLLVKWARHRRQLKEFFSSEKTGSSLNWLAWITLAFLGAHTFIALFSGALPSFLHLTTLSPVMADIYALCLFVFLFALFSGQQPPIYPRPAESEEGTPARYRRSGLREEDALALAEKLKAYMASERPWRDSELNVVSLAQAVGVSRHHLTQVLNEVLRENFHTWINRHRIDEVTSRLGRDGSDESLLYLAFDAGFTSKSTFNRVFKALRGVTPSEWRRERKGEETPP